MLSNYEIWPLTDKLYQDNSDKFRCFRTANLTERVRHVEQTTNKKLIYYISTLGYEIVFGEWMPERRTEQNYGFNGLMHVHLNALLKEEGY